MTNAFPPRPPAGPPPPAGDAAETARVLRGAGAQLQRAGDPAHSAIFYALAELVTTPDTGRLLARAAFHAAVYDAIDVPLVDEVTLDATIAAFLDANASGSIR